MSRQGRTIAVVLVAAVLTPILARAVGLPSQYWAVVIAIGVAYALMALSLNLMLGHAGLLSLGHAGFLALGAFVSGAATVRLRLPMGVALLIVVAVGSIVAFALGRVIARLSGVYVAIATLAFAVTIEELMSGWSGFSGGRAGIVLPRPMIGSFILDNEADYLALLLICLAAFLALEQNLAATRLGRAMHATRWSPAVAGALAVDVADTKVAATVLAGSAGAASGALYGHLVGLVSAETFAVNAQQSLSLILVILVILGGVSSPGGIVAAALLFAVVPVVAAPFRAWEFVLGGVALMVAVVRHPEGLGRSLLRQRPGGALPADIDFPRGDGEREPASLELHEVTVEFGGYTALDTVSLVVPEGALHGVIGPNGAGKSTLLAAIAGQVSYSGRVALSGRSLEALGAHERARLGIARTFQGGGLIPNVTTRENLLLAGDHFRPYSSVSGLVGGRGARWSEAKARARIEEVATALGLADRLDALAGTLSQGQQRIVEIARVLMMEPTVLLLDEPSAGLSQAAVEHLVTHLEMLRDPGSATVLVVDHSEVVRHVCSTVTVLEAGVVVAEGPLADVERHPSVAAYLGAV